MKFSWNWLSDYVDLSGIAPSVVAERFTMTVAELEGVEAFGAGLEGVTTGRISHLSQHPDADKLKIFEIDLGGRFARGVSGAPNLAVGAIVPVAEPGVVLPGGVEIRAAVIRGVASSAVLLSERELGLSDDHTGVLVLPEDTPVGRPLPEAIPYLRDTVFEVDNKSITHRPDLWGHEGIAREVAALVGRPFKEYPKFLYTPPELPYPFVGPENTSVLVPGSDQLLDMVAKPLAITVDDPRDCPRYMAVGFTGVTVAPSPFWVRHRLRAVGLRPISNVVDVSNWVMLALGEPNHAFDRRRIAGDTIRVRRAADGETFRTLDGVDHVLTADDLLIADAERGVALAGVMGGLDSEIADDTTDVVLEVATFHPGLIRRTAVRHNARTDSSARFEKSLDPNLTPRAAALFHELLARLCPAAAVSTRVYDVASFRREPLRIAIRPDYIDERLGLSVPDARKRRILSDLGFVVADAGEGAWDVTVPSFRATRDVSIPEDLVEEIGRVVGYDQVPPTGPLATVQLIERLPHKVLLARARRVLALACGLDEVLTYSFDSLDLQKKIAYAPADPLRVRNAVSADATVLRTELVPGLLGALERNATRNAELGIFEIGRVFRATQDEGGIPLQPLRLALLLHDRAAKTAGDVTTLFRRTKGVLAHLLDALGLGALDTSGPVEVEGFPWIVPVASCSVRAGDRTIGYCTRVHPAVCRAIDCGGSAFVAELDVAALLEASGKARKFVPVPRFPAIQADLSLIVDDAVRAGDIEAAIRGAAGEHLAGVEVVAVYAGAPIPEGRKSVSFRMTFMAPDRTLADAEVKAAVDRVLAATAPLGASVREG